MNGEVFAAVAFIGVGTGILLWSLWGGYSALASRRWPEIAGTIVVSDLQRSDDSDSNGGYLFRPEVSYQYTVAEKQFVSSRARFGGHVWLNWSAPAVRVVQRYKVGTRVSVRYDPDDPGEAVLETSINGLVFAGTALGAAVLTIGVFWLRSSL